VKGTNKGGMPGSWFIRKELSGGGAMLDHSVHVVDLINWITQAKVCEVYAESGTLFHDIDIDDSGMVHFKYDNGVVAVLDTSWSRIGAFPYRRDLSLEIIGTNGVIRIDDTTQVNEVYSKEAGKAQWSFWGPDRNADMIQDFVTAIRQTSPVPITGEDGYRSALVALAAYESARTGQPRKVWI
jgi:myo-inositol 2-dehydrogenase/D-chiro-inositol 1-dehydrogenase